MTEDDVRRIIREELDRAFPQRHAIVPLPTLPMPRYDYQRPYYPGGPWPVTCGAGVHYTTVLASIPVAGE